MRKKEMDHRGSSEFTFQKGQNQKFTCKLLCGRCEAPSKGGERCKRSVCVGRPMCWQHAVSNKCLKLAKSTIPGAGCGVFAWKPKPPYRCIAEPLPERKENEQVVFEEGDLIGKYDGEEITQQEQNARYGNHTGPYLFGTKGKKGKGKSRAGPGKLYDGACKRSMMAMINHSDEPNVEAHTLTSAGGGVEIRALQPIYHGEELLLNYGAGYEFEGHLHRTKPPLTSCTRAPH